MTQAEPYPDVIGFEAEHAKCLCQLIHRGHYLMNNPLLTQAPNRVLQFRIQDEKRNDPANFFVLDDVVKTYQSTDGVFCKSFII
jgi:hypothetical protein